jgi:leucyl/phenylalanyl-tRNA--protein transferase
MYLLNKQISFPPVEEANKDGLLAIGGDLSTERLLEAYRCGIFPWYDEAEPICWWSPDPRCVLFPSELHISKSMQHIINRKQFIFKINHSFEKTISGCRLARRKGDPGTWIHDELIKAYCKWLEVCMGSELGRYFLEKACSVRFPMPVNLPLLNLCRSCRRMMFNW